MKVSVKSVSYFLPVSDLNANADRPSSVLSHSWSSSVRMDTSTPLHQHEVVCSNLTVLKLRHVPVKPAEKQKFTDGHGLPKRRGVRCLKHMMEVSLEDISYLSCEPDLDASVDHSLSPLLHSESREVRMDKRTPVRPRPAAPRSKLPILKSKCVPVKPVNQQRFTDEPSEWLGVDSNHMKKGSQSVRMDNCRPLRQHTDAPRSKLPVLKSKCVPVKPVNQQSFKDEPSEWLGVDSNHMMKGSQPVRMDKRTPLRKHPVAGHSKLPVLESKCVPVRVGKSQHPAAVSTHSPVLRRRCAPVKLLSRQKIIDEAPERQVSRFPPLVNKAERNGADPSCGSDCKVESHLSLPSLPRLTSGVKMDEHVPLPVPVFANLPALKPAHVAMRPALPSNFMFFPLDNDVKMKRTRSITRSPPLLSRFHSATYF
ncbi:uncharacterized protein isoform X2 [Danio rerio]